MRNFISLACLLACLSSSTLLAKTDDDDDDKPKAAATKLATTGDTGETLSLAPKNQLLAGIQTRHLEAVQRQPEFSAYGTVVGLEPLLQLRQQFLAARAQQDSAQAKYTEANLNLSRTQDLQRQDIVSTRRLQEQQAQWQADKANLAASGYQQQTILSASRLEWGDTLTDWFIQAPGKAADQFLHRGAQLLQITLPAGTSLEAEVKSIFIDEHGKRENAVKATLISAAPRIDPISQGERYFFKSEGRRIPFGAHVSAWIPHGTSRNGGVAVPESAIIRHMGQSFVFVKTADDKFSRRPLTSLTATGHGYFETESLQADEEIVTVGAQTLLSQQLKSQIPSEDDD